MYQQQQQQQQTEASGGMSNTELVEMDNALTGLTNENLSVRVNLISRIPINTTEAMSQLVDIIYKKAVDEGSCPVMFAKIFQCLSTKSVKKTAKRNLFFRTLIINRCQKEFEMWTGIDSTVERVIEIGACSDAKKKENVESNLVCEESDQRQKYTRNLMLIGEMYKLHFLTSAIMMRIIGTLLTKKDEVSLESLCKLLTSIGKILETQSGRSPKKQSELNTHFNTMELIMKESQTTNEVKSLLRNVIEMRRNNWLSVGEDTTTKTALQLHHQEHGPFECGVCMCEYNEVNHRPRNLSCGHTYCSTCVSALSVNTILTCPGCRTNHCVTGISQFPINYALEAVMKAVRVQQVEAASLSSGETAKGTGECDKGMESQTVSVKSKWRANKGLSKKMQSLIDEQRANVQSLQTNVQEELEQLKQYRTQLSKCHVSQMELLEELNTVRQQTESNIKLLMEEDVRVEALVGEGEEVEKELGTACIKLDQVTEAQKAVSYIDEADHTVVEVEEWLQHIREDIPNGPALSTAFKMFMAIKKGLKVIKKKAGVSCEQVTSGHLDCTIMEAVKLIEGGPVELVDLRSERLKKSLDNGRVFAVQKYEDDICYSSKVISKEGKVYLYSLKKEPIPLGMFTLQVNKTLEKLTCNNISVFMDLTWPGAALSSQRITISFTSDTPLIRYFVTHCLGHTGLAYCDTNFASAEGYTNGLNIVWGPDIRHQKAVTNQGLPSIQDPQCIANNGMVVARIAGDTIQFGIAISSVCFGRRDRYALAGVGNQYFYQVGSVDPNGQSFLQRAHSSNQIPNVRVENCGVVIY